MSDTPDEDGFVYVEAEDIVWGAIQLGLCPDCIVTHEWANVYSAKVNPLESELIGVIYLCDELLEDDDDDEEWFGGGGF